jgi:hypothetical protein
VKIFLVNGAKNHSPNSDVAIRDLISILIAQGQ